MAEEVVQLAAGGAAERGPSRGVAPPAVRAAPHAAVCGPPNPSARAGPFPLARASPPARRLCAAASTRTVPVCCAGVMGVGVGPPAECEK